MAQTTEGAVKVAARRAGVTPAEYKRLVAAGQKWCVACRRWQAVEEFGADRSRADGRAASCRDGRNALARSTYEPKPARHPVRGRSYATARDGDRTQARGRVNYLVRLGLLADPNDLPCSDCGHVWTEGERRHEYDHHRGYGAAHHEDVQACCTTCHARRARDRGEVVQHRGERGRYVTSEVMASGGSHGDQVD